MSSEIFLLFFVKPVDRTAWDMVIYTRLDKTNQKSEMPYGIFFKHKG